MPEINRGHAPEFNLAVNITDCANATLAFTGTAAQSSALNGGFYDLWTDQDVYVKVATTANDVTTSTGYLLRAGATVCFKIPDGYKIGAIRASVSGTLNYHMVG